MNAPPRFAAATILPLTLFTMSSFTMSSFTMSSVRAADVSGRIVLDGGETSRGQLARTMVFLEEHPQLRAAPPEGPRPQIVQRGKAFVPDLLVVVQGTTVEFPNRDPFSHNVFSRSRAAQFDLERYRQGESKSYSFDTAGVVQLFCNIHPQMKATVLIVPNRCFTRADTRGNFTLRDVPPGRFVLVAWHENAGHQRFTLDVPPDGRRGVQVTLAATTVRPQAAPQARTRGVERGLGVKRQRLNLPVVTDSHPAPPPRGGR